MMMMMTQQQLLLLLMVVSSAGIITGTSATLLLENAFGKSAAADDKLDSPVRPHAQNGSANYSNFFAAPSWRFLEASGSAGSLMSGGGGSDGEPGADATLRRVRRGFIFPGTMWCGAGNNANSYDDLGELADTDRCCRDHDHCPHLIGAFEYKYSYRNYRWHTILHCDCDTSFKRCLRDCNNTASRNVGQAYFNIIGMPCFTFQYEQRCTERMWWGKCLKYEELPVAYVQNQKHFDYEGIEVSGEVENNVDPTDGDTAPMSAQPLEVTTTTEHNHQLPARTGTSSPPKTTEPEILQPSVTIKGGARKNKQRHGKNNQKHGRKSMRGFGNRDENFVHWETNEVRVNSTLRQYTGSKRRGGGKRRGQQKKHLGRKRGIGKHLKFEPSIIKGLSGRGQYGAVNAGEVSLHADVFEKMSNSISLPTVQPKRLNRLRTRGRRNGRRKAVLKMDRC
uniref:phospholipase A2 n=1 Tax=Petromyzon marinus TaxID=7757 RepID=A0AAJ7SR08_PETMA|nr:group 3 secretory phospholipase A2 [Petromyzon marinus]